MWENKISDTEKTIYLILNTIWELDVQCYKVGPLKLKL